MYQVEKGMTVRVAKGRNVAIATVGKVIDFGCNPWLYFNPRW